MPSIVDHMRNKTHKGAETDRRVYYTVHADAGTAPRAEIHRITKLLGMLVAKLQAQGVLTEDEIDGMLLEIAE